MATWRWQPNSQIANIIYSFRRISIPTAAHSGFSSESGTTHSLEESASIFSISPSLTLLSKMVCSPVYSPLDSMLPLKGDGIEAALM